MKIKSIELKNYRLYKGVNTISFPNDNEKNLFLISGQNGFGKTTFLHSLLWCLYGRLIVDVDESFRKEMFNGKYNIVVANNLNEFQRIKLANDIPQKSIAHIKRNGYTFDTEYIKEFSQYAVSLEFTDIFIPSIPCRSLKITRTYDIIREEETVEILIDGAKNELTTEIGHEVFINDFILNKDIARFFFFDSEKIVSLADTNTLDEKRKLCSAYNEVLGVKKYEDLKRNLENMRLRFRRKSDDVDSRNKLNSLLTKQKSLQESIKAQEQQTEELNERLVSLRNEDEKLQIQLLREGNATTLEELNRQEELLEKNRIKDDEYKQRLKLFLEFAPFAISGKLLHLTKEQLIQDFNISQSQNNIQNQNKLLQNISSDLLEVIENISFTEKNKEKLKLSINQILTNYSTQATAENALLNINKEDFDEFLSVYSNITTTYRVEFIHLADDYRKNKQVMERTARSISNMHSKEDDSVIKNIRKQKNECERKIADSEMKIRKLHEERGAINKDLAVIGRQISELSKKVSLDDSDSKKDQVAEQLIAELNTFLVSLKNEKKNSLERRIKATLNSLMHKTDFIGKVDVVIADDIIDINLYSTDGNEIKTEMLSKGEQQLYATSLLKALVEESGIQFPVFIDSPLQKFDKSHANKIITEFYPTVSKQVVLFPLLHKELTECELEIMKPFVNATYLLKNEKSYSQIQQIDINYLMKE